MIKHSFLRFSNSSLNYPVSKRLLRSNLLLHFALCSLLHFALCSLLPFAAARFQDSLLHFALCSLLPFAAARFQDENLCSLFNCGSFWFGRLSLTVASEHSLFCCHVPNPYCCCCCCCWWWWLLLRFVAVLQLCNSATLRCNASLNK